MKLVSFEANGKESIGIAVPDRGRIFDLTSAVPDDTAFTSMLALIDAGPEALARACNLCVDVNNGSPLLKDISEVRILAPLPVPRQIRDFSVFPGHIRQAPAGMARINARRDGDMEALAAVKPLDEVPPVYRQLPIYYLSNRFSVIGPNVEIPWPRYSNLMDFELEFAAVIGKKGRDIPRDLAHEHIFGYMIYNDFSARDTQNVEMQSMLGPTKGKSFDCGNAMGPWLVTVDEIIDPYTLDMSVSVNGEVWSEGNSSGMLHTFEDMIAYVSRDETLHAGEVFGSGTIGNGCGLEIDRFLNDGDVVTLRVEGLGELSNRVVRQQD